MLSKLNSKVRPHMEFAHALTRSVMTSQRTLVTADSFRSFPNSLSHRHKHRGITTFLMLLPFVDKVMFLLLEAENSVGGGDL